MPSSDGGGVGDPLERLRVGVVIVEEAVDGGLEVCNGSKHAALELRLVRMANKPSTALSQEDEVGVKWNVQRGWRASHRRTPGCLWAA